MQIEPIVYFGLYLVGGIISCVCNIIFFRSKRVSPTARIFAFTSLVIFLVSGLSVISTLDRGLIFGYAILILSIVRVYFFDYRNSDIDEEDPTNLDG
ncbi:MAG: hypothetical protein ACW98Y_10910 [Candidatus Thorarchaeota archaeon]